MRKRYEKMFSKEYKSFFKNYRIRKHKKYSLKDYFRDNHICFQLWGKMSSCDGVRSYGWGHKKNDLLVCTDDNFSRKEVKALKRFAFSIKKELFICFSWTPKGIPEVVLTFIIEKLTELIIQKMFDYLKQDFNEICVVNEESKLNIDFIKKDNQIIRFEIDSFKEHDIELFKQIINQKHSSQKLKIYNDKGIYEKEHSVGLLVNIGL